MFCICSLYVLWFLWSGDWWGVRGGVIGRNSEEVGVRTFGKVQTSSDVEESGAGREGGAGGAGECRSTRQVSLGPFGPS